jgi:hypothetical protein
MGSMFGRANRWAGNGASDHAAAVSTADGAGTATAVLSTSGESVPSQTVSSDSGTAASNTATVSPVANNAAVGGEIRGGARRLFGRTVRGGMARNAAGESQSARNTAGGSVGGGVRNRVSGTTQYAGLMNRMRRR